MNDEVLVDAVLFVSDEKGSKTSPFFPGKAERNITVRGKYFLEKRKIQKLIGQAQMASVIKGQWRKKLTRPAMGLRRGQGPMEQAGTCPGVS